jgi:YD repeat-containing protein
VPETAQVCPRCGCGLSGGGTAQSIAVASPTSDKSALRLVLIILGCSVAVILGSCVAILLAWLHFPISETEAYKESVVVAQASRDAQTLLGSGIDVKSPAWGYVTDFRGSKFAEWSVKLAGSRGKGHLYGIANETRGSWEYSRLELVSDDSEKRLDLTPAPAALKFPPVPVRHVYLVPMGLTDGESLDWAPAYYKAKLGIDVTVVAPVPLDPKLVDARRNQLDANKCVDFLRQIHPELVADPFAILIGVTSTDMNIPGLQWRYAENWRSDGRFAIVSSARLHPPSVLGNRNPEWLNSRVQKLLSKNLLILYFNCPMSSDYTSLLSGGVLSGMEVDQMGGDVIGAEGSWDPFVESGDPSVSIYDVRGKPVMWNLEYAGQALPDTNSQVFSADLTLGLLVQRKADFLLDGAFPLQFTRVYRNQDERSRAFGIGGTNSLEIYLIGQMGRYVDLIMEDGARIHFEHDPVQHGQPFDTYLERGGWTGPFANSKVEYLGTTWRLTRRDGWVFFFPYKPKWDGHRITILTSFSDAEGHDYEMKRDDKGNLVDITTPSGAWLHFENDAEDRIRRITSSLGRAVDYEYDRGGRLIRVKDSEGHVDGYSYGDKGAMLTASHETAEPILRNEYFSDGYLKSQIMADGRKFEYTYYRSSRNIIEESGLTDPNGLMTSFLYRNDGYVQSLPTYRPR